MENQHRKITGYRDLTQADIDLMNKIKAHAVATEALTKEAMRHYITQIGATTAVDSGNPDVANCRTPQQQAEWERLTTAEPYRWIAIAVTDFQTGFMALTRAVAQPTTF